MGNGTRFPRIQMPESRKAQDQGVDGGGEGERGSNEEGRCPEQNGTAQPHGRKQMAKRGLGRARAEKRERAGPFVMSYLLTCESNRGPSSHVIVVTGISRCNCIISDLCIFEACASCDLVI